MRAKFDCRLVQLACLVVMCFAACSKQAAKPTDDACVAPRCPSSAPSAQGGGGSHSVPSGSGGNGGNAASSSRDAGGASAMDAATGGASGSSQSGDDDGGSSAADAGVDSSVPDRDPPLTTFGAFTGVCAYSTDDFAALQALGIANARMDHPDAATIDAARQYGIEVLPLADYGFADLSGHDDQMYPPLPENRSAWAKRMVDKWRDMQKPPKVLEVWNEPWNAGFWKPTPDAAAYLELFKAFAAEAWAVWPDATLLVSADTDGSPDGYMFRDQLLAADMNGFLNDPRILPTTHNYVEGRTPTEVTSGPCRWDLDRFDCAYDAFKAHGHPDPQVWVTEFGWESNTANGTNAVTPVTEQQQADYVTQALQIFRASGKVAKAYSFLFHTDDPWNYNWLRPDNTQKPVCQSVQSLIANGH